MKFDRELQLLNTKLVIKNELKKLMLEKFKVYTLLVLDYKKSNDGKIFHSSPKLIVGDLDI